MYADERNRRKMDRHFFEKRCHYSIRKFAIGAASVMIGASIFGANMVQAAETATPSEAGEVSLMFKLWISYQMN